MYLCNVFWKGVGNCLVFMSVVNLYFRFHFTAVCIIHELLKGVDFFHEFTLAVSIYRWTLSCSPFMVELVVSGDTGVYTGGHRFLPERIALEYFWVSAEDFRFTGSKIRDLGIECLGLYGAPFA